MARRRIKDENGNYIWFDTDQEYYDYLQMIRNSWPNRIKRFFNKVLAIIAIIVFILFAVAICTGKDKGGKVQKEKSKVEKIEKKQAKEAKDEVKQVRSDEQVTEQAHEEVGKSEEGLKDEVVKDEHSLDADVDRHTVENSEETHQKPIQEELKTEDF